MRERKERNNTTERPHIFQGGAGGTKHFSGFAISFQNIICSYISKTQKSSIYSMKTASLPLHLHLI